MTTNKTENRELVIANVTSNLNNLIKQQENVAGKKTLLSKPEGDDIASQVIRAYKAKMKELNELAKEVKQRIESELTALDAVEAAQVVSVICMSPEGADTAERNRFNRRRQALKKTLTDQFPDYEFGTEKVNNRARITAHYIGSPYRREAKEMLSVIEKLAAYGYDMPKIDLDELETKVESTVVVKTNGLDQTPVETGEPVKDTMADLNALIEGAEGPKANEAKVEKEATN